MQVPQGGCRASRSGSTPSPRWLLHTCSPRHVRVGSLLAVSCSIYFPWSRVHKPHIFPCRYRASLTGAVAAVVHELGPAIEPYMRSIASLALQATTDSDSQLKRNAAVCIANLAASGAPSASALLPEFLQALRPLFSDEQKVRATAIL